MAKKSFKIDRLTNNTLEFGLKTNATLTGSSNAITSSKVLAYSSDLTSSITEDNQVVNKKYVDSQLTTLDSNLTNYINNYITAGTRISLDKSEGSTVKIELAPAYADESSKEFTSTNTQQVINGIKVDEYGVIQEVTYKQISTADLDNAGNVFDNYRQWQLKAGAVTAEIGSSFRTEDDEEPIVPLEFTSSDGSMNISLSSGISHLLNFNLKVNSETNYPLYVDSGTGLNLRTVSGLEDGKPAALYRIQIDKFGRIVTAEAIDASDIGGSLKPHTSTESGIVLAIDTSASGNSTNSPANGIDTYFYTSDAKWSKIPYDKVTMNTASGTIRLLGTTAASNGLVSTVSDSQLTYDVSAQTLYAPGFSGNGANLTNLSASNITGTLNSNVIPQLEQSKINLGLSQPGSLLYTNSSNLIAEVPNPVNNESSRVDFVLSKSVDVGGGGANSIPQWTNIKNLVTNIVAGEGGMSFQGTIGTPENGGQYSDIPVSFGKGYFYKIVTSGTYLGIFLEAGDTLFAIKDSGEEYASADIATKRSYWSILQANVDRPVSFSDTSLLSNATLVVKANGNNTLIYEAANLVANYTTDKWTIGTDITGNAGSASKLKTSSLIWGKSFDGSEDISGDLSGVGNIIPATNATSNIGAVSETFANAYINTVHGNLNGNATSADKVNNALTFGTQIYDGSQPVEIDLSATTLGFVKDFTDGASSGSGKFLTGISFSKATDGVVTVTRSLASAIETLSSSLFNISTDSGTATISLLTTEASGAIYASNNANPTSTNQYGFGGILTARDLYVSRSGTPQQVAVLGNGTETSPGGKKLLVADSTSSTYGFKKTEISVESAPSWSVDNQIPTAAAVANKITEEISDNTRGSSHYLRLSLTNASVTSMSSIPSGSYIHEIHVRVKTAYSETATLSINIGNTLYVATTDLDLTTAGDSFTFIINDDTINGGNVVANLTLGSTPTVGALAITVVYVDTFNN